MRKLLLASILIAIGLSAHAAIVIDDQGCTGSDLDRVCAKSVACLPDPCQVLLDPTASSSATCIPQTEVGLSVTLIANRDGDNPICSWFVDDGLGEIAVTIDSNDGLPVEVLSFSVE